MKRDEAIEKKRVARDQRFLEGLEEQKKMVETRDKMRMAKIENEKAAQYADIERRHQEELNHIMELRSLDNQRLATIKEKEEVRQENEEKVVRETIMKYREERE